MILELNLTVFVFDNDNNHYEVSHAVANDGEFHTYYFKLDNWSRFADNTIKEFRFDFSGIIGDVLEYKNVRAVKADTGGSPDIRLCRYIHMFGDKTQQVIQISAQKTTEGIEEIGVVMQVAKSSVMETISSETTLGRMWRKTIVLSLMPIALAAVTYSISR